MLKILEFTWHVFPFWVSPIWLQHFPMSSSDPPPPPKVTKHLVGWGGEGGGRGWCWGHSTLKSEVKEHSLAHALANSSTNFAETGARFYHSCSQITVPECGWWLVHSLPSTVQTHPVTCCETPKATDESTDTFFWLFWNCWHHNRGSSKICACARHVGVFPSVVRFNIGINTISFLGDFEDAGQLFRTEQWATGTNDIQASRMINTWTVLSWPRHILNLDLRVCLGYLRRLEKATEIKAPAGRVNQKYVYSSFMVKMRIDLWSFRLFWFNLSCR